MSLRQNKCTAVRHLMHGKILRCFLDKGHRHEHKAFLPSGVSPRDLGKVKCEHTDGLRICSWTDYTA